MPVLLGFCSDGQPWAWPQLGCQLKRFAENMKAAFPSRGKLWSQEIYDIIADCASAARCERGSSVIHIAAEISDKAAAVRTAQLAWETSKEGTISKFDTLTSNSLQLLDLVKRRIEPAVGPTSPRWCLAEPHESIWTSETESIQRRDAIGGADYRRHPIKYGSKNVFIPAASGEYIECKVQRQGEKKAVIQMVFFDVDMDTGSYRAHPGRSPKKGKSKKREGSGTVWGKGTSKSQEGSSTTQSVSMEQPRYSLKEHIDEGEMTPAMKGLKMCYVDGPWKGLEDLDPSSVTPETAQDLSKAQAIRNTLKDVDSGKLIKTDGETRQLREDLYELMNEYFDNGFPDYNYSIWNMTDLEDAPQATEDAETASATNHDVVAGPTALSKGDDYQQDTAQQNPSGRNPDQEPHAASESDPNESTSIDPGMVKETQEVSSNTLLSEQVEAATRTLGSLFTKDATTPSQSSVEDSWGATFGPWPTATSEFLSNDANSWRSDATNDGWKIDAANDGEHTSKKEITTMTGEGHEPLNPGAVKHLIVNPSKLDGLSGRHRLYVKLRDSETQLTNVHIGRHDERIWAVLPPDSSLHPVSSSSIVLVERKLESLDELKALELGCQDVFWSFAEMLLVEGAHFGMTAGQIVLANKNFKAAEVAGSVYLMTKWFRRVYSKVWYELKMHEMSKDWVRQYSERNNDDLARLGLKVFIVREAPTDASPSRGAEEPKFEAEDTAVSIKTTETIKAILPTIQEAEPKSKDNAAGFVTEGAKSSFHGRPEHFRRLVINPSKLHNLTGNRWLSVKLIDPPSQADSGSTESANTNDHARSIISLVQKDLRRMHFNGRVWAVISHTDADAPLNDTYVLVEKQLGSRDDLECLQMGQLPTFWKSLEQVLIWQRDQAQDEEERKRCQNALDRGVKRIWTLHNEAEDEGDIRKMVSCVKIAESLWVRRMETDPPMKPPPKSTVAVLHETLSMLRKIVERNRDDFAEDGSKVVLVQRKSDYEKGKDGLSGVVIKVQNSKCPTKAKPAPEDRPQGSGTDALAAGNSSAASGEQGEEAARDADDAALGAPENLERNEATAVGNEQNASRVDATPWRGTQFESGDHIFKTTGRAPGLSQLLTGTLQLGIGEQQPLR